ncbi:MAG: peptidoglycan-binding domain-containing protein [Casimicrobium sp.]
MRPSFITPIFEEGSVGPTVSNIQAALNLLPSALILLNVDGVFGPKTRARVIEFQKLMRLVVDGKVGPKTMGQIDALIGDVSTAIANYELRMRVLAVARIEAMGLGRPPVLNAALSGGIDPANPSKHFRLGHQRLAVYFHLAAPAYFLPGMQTEENIRHQKDGASPTLAPLPHWCGIFALWAHKTAGTPNMGTWVVGAGIAAVSGFKSVPSAGVLMPADIGYISSPHQHHVLIERVYLEGGMECIDTIEGNSFVGSSINIRKKSTRARFSGFYRATSLAAN